MKKEVIKKICLLGDGAVGKTSLIRRYVYDFFDDKYIKTIGTKVTKKTLTLSDKLTLTLLIYDILGQKDYERLHKLYYRGSSGALVVSDVTREDTLENMSHWAKSLRDGVGDIPLVFICNKTDLKKTTTKAIADRARPFNASCFLTSAKTGKNVENAFKSLSEMLCKEMLKECE